jgi:uncharacterized protein (DUF305 family)
MAEAAKAGGLTQPDLSKIADDIIESQQREIDQMLSWREEWFGSRTLGPVLPEVLGVPESELGMEHGSADEIAGAVDVDAMFAEMMIPHHEGAIAMAEAAKERGQHEEVKDLAQAIIEAQEREIESWKNTPPASTTDDASTHEVEIKRSTDGVNKTTRGTS